MTTKTRIGVVFRGRSGEHEVSLASAASVLEHLNREIYEIIPIAITQQGTWLWGIEPQQLIQARSDPALAGTLTNAPAVTLRIGGAGPQPLIDIQSGKSLPSDGAL